MSSVAYAWCRRWDTARGSVTDEFSRGSQGVGVRGSLNNELSNVIPADKDRIYGLATEKSGQSGIFTEGG